jgi:hypothetical protein
MHGRATLNFLEKGEAPAPKAIPTYVPLATRI